MAKYFFPDTRGWKCTLCKYKVFITLKLCLYEALCVYVYTFIWQNWIKKYIKPFMYSNMKIYKEDHVIHEIYYDAKEANLCWK